jgi:1-acyl-sn-glycerol-3-phosphate acyltransferase
MPPASVRRPVTVTLWLLVSIAVLVLSPVLLALAALASAVTGRPQMLIFTRLAVVYFALELAVLIACGGLWLAACGGLLMKTPLFQRLHVALLRQFVHVFTLRWIALLEIEMAEEETSAASRALEADGPLLFFSRHAGPGDTILLIDRLLTRYERSPSVVFKESVAIDPCVDLIAHRLPHAVLDTADKEACEARIEEVAAGLGERGVLLLFPEGGNFTAERRRRAIRKLRRSGRRREAARAERMDHVLPPRPSGALAALRGNPGAEVVFAAHSGLGLAAFPREVWQQTPLTRTFTSAMWLAPVAERPADPEAQVVWLYDWWKRLDDWVDAQGSETPAAAHDGSTTAGPSQP